MRALSILTVLAVLVAWAPERTYADAPVKPVLALRADASESVRFGSPFHVNVTITNSGAQEVRWPAGAVRVEPAGWDTEGRGGTGPGDGVVVTSDASGKDVAIPGGGSVVCKVPADALAQQCLGRVQAYFELRDNAPKPLTLWSTESGRTRLAVQIQPSLLMESAWAARTDEQRATVQKEFNTWLRRTSDPQSIDRRVFLTALEYLGGYALEYFEHAASEGDVVEREWALRWFPHAVWTTRELNTRIKPLPGRTRPPWAAGLREWDENAAALRCHNVTVQALADADESVRVAAVKALTDRKDREALPAVVPLAEDTQVPVRRAALTYLSLFADDAKVAAVVTGRLGDVSGDVSQEAMQSLEHSPTPPPVGALREAFAAARGPAALRLLSLLREQEDADLPKALVAGFAQRGEAERVAILSALAGHNDENARQLVQLGLADRSVAVQRVALLRLLSFPREAAEAMLGEYHELAPAEVAQLLHAVADELQQRKVFGFLPAVAATETVFPSRNGTVPMVSPDGKWLAYTESGWGRRGGSGGFGRSNLESLAHVVRVDGTESRVVSVMFLAGWLADSRRLATCRDGYAAVSDLEGNILAEFGEPLPPADAQPANDQRAKGKLLHDRFGVMMPHSKRLRLDHESDYGENAAFSPDGLWFGPVGTKGIFLAADGNTMQIPLAEGQHTRGHAAWSPDGKYVAIWRDREMMVLDMARKTVLQPKMPIDAQVYGTWEYRKCRWNPWSRDSKQLTFVRDGQVWVSNAEGTNARSVTFDSTRKAWPTFSPNGSRLSYVTWQESRRGHSPDASGMDVWVVDLQTTLCARLTAPHREQVFCLDWLDDQTIIFDRVGSADPIGYTGALYTITLAQQRAPAAGPPAGR